MSPRVPNERIATIDALRGFALGGILLVNIQSFCWGAGNPLGYFPTPPGWLDQAIYLLLAIAVAGKFYAIFAFLFGVGFAIQWRALKRRAGNDLGAARRIYLRRLAFLLAVGVAHGMLLYFGDILTAYALCALFLLALAPVRTRHLIWWAVFCWLLTYAVIGAWITQAWPAAMLDVVDIPWGLRATFAVYTQRPFSAQIGVRVQDYLSQNTFGVFFFWPQVVAIFILGVIAGRQGWLRAPERHPRVWRRAWQLGVFVGLPCAVLGSWLQMRGVRDAPGADIGIEALISALGSWVAAIYVGAFVRWRDLPAMQRMYAWLIPAGRMPLTNYIMQSVAMGALLSGWALGLCAVWQRPVLTLVAMGMFIGQIVISRAWAIRYRQGPLEALWRLATYGKTPGRSSSKAA